MNSDQIRTELHRRIQLAGTIPAKLAKAVRLEPEVQAIDETRTINLPSHPKPSPGESSPIRGEIPFELTLSAFGETVIHSCRARYVMTLQDEVVEGHEPVRTMAGMTTTYDILDWTHPDQCKDANGEPVRVSQPRWLNLDLFPLIPRVVEAKLDNLMLADAIARDQTRSRGTQSNA